jgi:hypothetical protein
MSYTITATAPTVYQLNSLTAFGMGYKKNGNGSFSASQQFDTEDMAKEYLKNRAAMYNDDDPEGTYERLMEMFDSIDRFGSLTLDAVSAHIEEAE